MNSVGSVRCRGADGGFQLGDGDGAATNRQTAILVSGFNGLLQWEGVFASCLASYT